MEAKNRRAKLDIDSQESCLSEIHDLSLEVQRLQRLAVCHQCGFEVRHEIVLQDCRRSSHVFCDTDCLRSWMDDRSKLFQLGMKEDEKEMIEQIIKEEGEEAIEYHTEE